MKKKEPEKVAFTDGLLQLFSPLEPQVEKAHFYFSDFTVGVNRFYSAMLAGVEVARCVRIPQSSIKLDGTESVVIEGKTYYIKQIQKKGDTFPKTLLLTLSETG